MLRESYLAPGAGGITAYGPLARRAQSGSDWVRAVSPPAEGDVGERWGHRGPAIGGLSPERERWGQGMSPRRAGERGGTVTPGGCARFPGGATPALPWADAHPTP